MQIFVEALGFCLVSGSICILFGIFAALFKFFWWSRGSIQQKFTGQPSAVAFGIFCIDLLIFQQLNYDSVMFWCVSMCTNELLCCWLSNTILSLCAQTRFLQLNRLLRQNLHQAGVLPPGQVVSWKELAPIFHWMEVPAVDKYIFNSSLARMGLYNSQLAQWHWCKMVCH